MENKKYQWDRNIPHHRMALTRFSTFAFLQSVFAGLITILGMGVASNGSSEYVVITSVMGMIAMIVTYGFFFMFMVIMYNWVVSEREDGSSKGKVAPDVFYQTETGWIKSTKKGGKGGKAGGGVR